MADLVGKIYGTRVGMYTNNIITPQNIVSDMLDMLPEEIWNPDTTFLDIYTKSGRFLKEAYKRLFNSPYLSDMSEQERKEHILTKQLYGLTDDGNCLLVSERNLYGRIYGGTRNIRLIENYKAIVKNKDSRFFKEAIAKEFNREMKFDVVMGNPPYNDTDETGSSKSVNTYFVNLGVELNTKYMAYIMPDRWFVSPDKFNTKCREDLVGKIRYMRDYDDNKEVFEGVNIAGGVSYFLYDKDYDGEMIYEDSRGKVNVKHNNRFMCKTTQSNVLYNHVKLLANQYMDSDYISTSFFGLTRNAAGKYKKTDAETITLKSSDVDTYLTLNEIPRNSKYAPLYKVAIPYSAMKPKPFILKPNEICTLTYLIIKFFDKEEDAENCKKYFETNFFKILFNGLKTKLGTTKENFMCIPNQDFTSQSDIDWSQSISDIDQQLYKKYNLTDEEIAYIESTIKPMS